MVVYVSSGRAVTCCVSRHATQRPVDYGDQSWKRGKGRTRRPRRDRQCACQNGLYCWCEGRAVRLKTQGETQIRVSRMPVVTMVCSQFCQKEERGDAAAGEAAYAFTLSVRCPEIF